MKKSPLAARVERALAVNRIAKLNFPGIFMKLTGERVGADAMRLEFPDDPVLRAGDGELHWPVLAVVLDVVLGAVTRLRDGGTRRPATVRLDVQMTGAPLTGEIATEAKLLAFSSGTRVQHALSQGVVRSGETVLAHASGAFVMLDLPPDARQAIEPWVPESLVAEAGESIAPDEKERAAIAFCRRAEAAATADHPFIEHFWCGVPKSAEGRASLNVTVTPHLGNRIGNVHGGILLGAAATVAKAAAPRGMRLSNITAWFVSPGLPPRLKVRSRVIHAGRNLCVVGTKILSAENKLVLEVTSQHVATEA